MPQVPADSPAIVPQARDGDWITRHNAIVSGYAAEKNYDIIFIGDSITQHWEDEPSTDGTGEGGGKPVWDEIKADYNVVNAGYYGDQTQNALWRIQNGEYPQGITAKYAVLLIGTNNSILGQDTPEAIAAAIGQMIQTIHFTTPDTKIILMSLLPRHYVLDLSWLFPGFIIEYDNTVNPAVNEIIKNYNGYCNVTYLDVTADYTDEEGEPKADLFMADKLHLSLEGFRKEKELLFAAMPDLAE
jgi:beta-glucosidase